MDRRTLIKMSLGATLGWSAGPLLGAGDGRQEGRQPLGIALVGLGKYATGQLAPALQETKLCRLAGIVTGSPDKARRWQAQYHLSQKNVYNYATFDEIAHNPAIDIVYVVLPNAMHAEYVIRAAKAKKHVICEKPMAITVAQCQAMIDACRDHGVNLSIGYRLHFEPHTQEMMRLGQKKVYGAVQTITAQDGMAIGDPNQWRLKKALAGGGPLMDVGIYCVQASCYVTGEKPMAIESARLKKGSGPAFTEVEEELAWTMRFPSGATADCLTSYSRKLNLLDVHAEHGRFMLQPAYSYRGIQGRTPNGPMHFPQVNQQARQMDDFAHCVITGQPTRVPGEMGLRDVKLLRAIYEAAKSQKTVALDWS
jgi:predicted dehydrogenase